MIKLYTPKQWHSLFDCPSLIIDNDGKIWEADSYYKILSGEPSGRIDYAGGKVYGRDLGYGMFSEPIAYLETKNGVIRVMDAKEGISSSPILYIENDKVYTPEQYCAVFDAPSGYIRQEDQRRSADSSAGTSVSGADYSGGASSGLGLWLLKAGGLMLAGYCVIGGIANALPIWASILLGIILVGGLAYKGWFSKDKSKQKAFRLAFWAVLIWFGFVAIMIARILH